MRFVLILTVFISIASCSNDDAKQRFENRNIPEKRECFISLYDSLNFLEQKKRYFNGIDGKETLQEYVYFDQSGQIDFDRSFFLFPLVNCDTIFTESSVYHVDYIGYFQNLDSCEVIITRKDINVVLTQKNQSKDIHIYIDNLHKGYNPVSFEIKPFLRVDSLRSRIVRHIFFDKIIYRN